MKVSELTKELGITRYTVYWYAANITARRYKRGEFADDDIFAIRLMSELVKHGFSVKGAANLIINDIQKAIKITAIL